MSAFIELLGGLAEALYEKDGNEPAWLTWLRLAMLVLIFGGIFLLFSLG